MSSINVKIVAVEILPHLNADRLEVARIGGVGGYECVVGKNQFKNGELAIYIPPDSVLPDNIMESLAKNKIQMKNNRLRAINIRGLLSEGLCLRPGDWLEDKDIFEDNDVTNILGITKYEPPPPSHSNVFSAGKGINVNYDNPKFSRYTDIENIKKYPKVLYENEQVVATVKFHGTNFRCAWVHKQNYKRSLWKLIKDIIRNLWDGEERIDIIDEDAQEFLVGSHNKVRYANKGADISNDLYWRAALKYDLKNVTKSIAKTLSLINYNSTPKTSDIILYGEIIGPKIQKGYEYGINDGDIEIRVFDIKFNGQFVDWPDVQFLCFDNKLPIVKSVYEGPWYPELVKKAEEIDEYNGQKYNREGIVIKSIKERWDARAGRVIFKALNPKYLLDKNNSEFH